MFSAHLLSLAEIDIYGKPDYSFHLPWFVKLSLIGMGVRAFIWVLQKLPKENKSLRKPVRTPAAASPPPPQSAPIPVVPAVTREILILRDDQQLGPYTIEEINRQLSVQAFEPSDLAWYEGLPEWRPLSSIAGVINARVHRLHPPPPPVRTTN